MKIFIWFDRVITIRNAYALFIYDQIVSLESIFWRKSEILSDTFLHNNRFEMKKKFRIYSVHTF